MLSLVKSSGPTTSEITGLHEDKMDSRTRILFLLLLTLLIDISSTKNIIVCKENSNCSNEESCVIFIEGHGICSKGSRTMDGVFNVMELLIKNKPMVDECFFTERLRVSYV
ncbi:unnamed protein product [Lepeophtheirus salmonis]|uniref:(salmon louse) hypothetical protein n=1 Tax=Lepeophtheirus salmonis TaxID=72036 RepID=A0A7R8CHR8_LEPSM|nr:unnamed protein product [Lepeophtheirus salmonis]CAF2826451.1 unnamed protein product [Lepeophtheirus salmonis]